MKAAVLAGLTGYGTALLLSHRAHLTSRLTQFCVETVSMIVPVLVQRRMPVRFEENFSRWATRCCGCRVALAGGAAVAVAVWIMAGTAGPTARGAASGRGDRAPRAEGRRRDDPGRPARLGHHGRVRGARHRPRSVSPAPIHLHRRADGGRAARTAAARRPSARAGLRTAWRASRHESAGLPSGDEGRSSGPARR